MEKSNLTVPVVLFYNITIIAMMLGAFWFFGNAWPALMVFLLADFRTHAN
jgi:hypothetical protein